MGSEFVTSYSAALAGMKVAGPINLERAVKFHAAEFESNPDVRLGALVEHLRSVSLNDVLRQTIHTAIAYWDVSKPEETWVGDTKPRTTARREWTYTKLGLPTELIDLFNELFPLDGDATVVISESFTPWYTPEERKKRKTTYYDAYSDYLAKKGWPADSLTSLEEATSEVVARLADPQQSAPYQAKGLVVGYVQSGKTANFTGVIAKAIDAGYRLIIVLTGTIEVLRKQTQRRIDMELIGKENILRGVDETNEELRADIDYLDDPDWDEKFIELGGLPSKRNLPDIIRLTTADKDFKSLRTGITALEFEKRNRAQPLWTPENLPFSSARVAIVKKNKSVLNKLLKDIERVQTHTAEIPTLIIDDESDQASINTKDPKKLKAGQADRTAINAAISGLLKMMPRAQYVGYTATPFANVFVDPSDAEDIFPKDFLISLKRPPEYMGVSDFHDLDKLDPDDRTFENSNENAIVRNATDKDGNSELLRCLDSFVLAGAIKLYREQLGEAKFRHHTMLVHESVKTALHEETANEVRSLWRKAAYSSPKCYARLRELFDSDFLPVCRARSDSFSVPETFDGLKKFVGAAIQKITQLDDPVIVVNGDKAVANEEVDFDKRDVWRVLVGGTKLSRGFTVEGLTISYYRRKTKQADTLMQMGRWFGFRQGYRDLVRLFVGRSEPDGKKTVDLYEAFEAIVKDEESFRGELKRYSTLVEGRPQITPKQIPPLVYQHLPWLRPAARNKMFNAELVQRQSPGSLVIPVGYPQIPTHTEDNYRAVVPLLAAAQDEATLLIPGDENTKASDFKAYLGMVSGRDVISSVAAIKWINQEYFAPDIRTLELACKDVKDWLVIAPQTLDQESKRLLPGVGIRTVVSRKIRETRGVWGEITDPKHRPAAQFIAGAISDYGDEELKRRKHRDMGAILIYPMVTEPRALSDEPNRGDVILAVAWISPEGKMFGDSKLVTFRVKDNSNPNKVTVPT